MNILRDLKYQGWTILWVVVILVFCNIRMPDTSGSGFFFEGFDKLVHLGFFYVLTILIFNGRNRAHGSYDYRLLTIIKVVLIGVLLGGGIEILQWKIFTYRSAEWWDLGCDMLGISMGVFSFVLLHIPKKRSI